MKNLVLMLLVLFFVSCASNHRLMRGTVAVKIDETKGIVCMESNAVKPGMKLSLYNTDCDRTPLRDIETCRLFKSGEVEVTRLLNDHYSEFKSISNAKFSEGSIIKFSNE